MFRMIATALAALILLAPPARAAVEPPALNEDGLYHYAWYKQSFLDLREDLGDAAAAGKRLVVFFEQKGCLYCKQVQTETMAVPEIHDYVRANFDVLQINLWGDREVTDLDGKVMTEKELGRRWNVMFTPTILFMPESLEKAAGGTGGQAAVAVMPGAFQKGTFGAMFHWVRDKGYETDEHFQKYLIRLLDEQAAKKK